ncbi:hypothetical protein EV659_101244 [Rhodothalassium salexigens DSM 2132]|uniref:Uncharacterized protein n=1 Tax=Rhodothalassium salexigens DSM 2132 TaxID=1188247 RepID=A0A4R2PT94_RHOSA|nr:hypothetical protein [Rhodothalassium salexigens]MBB4210180.1 hypothetical protein [Rhodothalassium salexigens DSM 2132]MBK1638556.1 hypothetical protein [Rhodothalassium salexigens DSM 2132]TCP38344.1 hypothetical protein EV659_101244 [Rhodothalassium salexigens DSM 2132]
MAQPSHIDVPHIIKWSLAVPVFAVWPFVSVFPVIGLFSPPITVWTITINLAFAASSMIGVFMASVALSFLQAGTEPGRRVSVGDLGVGRLALFGLGWLTVYGLYTTMWTGGA